jgi:hypothetical protein
VGSTTCRPASRSSAASCFPNTSVVGGGLYPRPIADEKPIWGDGNLEFARWETPFENDVVWVKDVAWRSGTPQLVVVVEVEPSTDGGLDAAARTYGVVFERGVSAFRLLDEGGLLELWGSGAWSGARTFRVRNHAWTRESLLSFTPVPDGWSYVIATHAECVEVIAPGPPQITLRPG